MSIRTGRTGIPIIAVALIIVVGVAAIWAVTPEDLRGLLLLTAGVVAAAAYGALFVIERRRHW